MKKHKTGWLTSKGERLSYYLFFAGQLIFNTIVMSYVLTLLLNNGVNVNAPIYDLSGRRVMNAVKGGIYIQNGKKFIVK
jgi:hypothetical protein